MLIRKRTIKINYYFLILLILITFSGCGCDQSDKEPTVIEVELQNNLTDSISTITDEEDIRLIVEYVESGYKEIGSIDYMWPTPYEVNLIYTDESTQKLYFSIYVDDSNSFYAYEGDLGTAYIVNIKRSVGIKELFDNIE